MAAAKGEEIAPDKSDCLIDISVDAYIPEEFIPDAAGRIEAYKRIAAIQTPEDAGDVLDELIDRYGDVPDCVAGLVDVSLVRVTAARAKVYEIDQKGDTLLLYSDDLNPLKLQSVFEKLGKRINLSATAKPCLTVRVRPDEKPLDVLRMTLEELDPGKAGA